MAVFDRIFELFTSQDVVIVSSICATNAEVIVSSTNPNPHLPDLIGKQTCLHCVSDNSQLTIVFIFSLSSAVRRGAS